ncbi:hypothetical protein V6N12_039918 [Hibiscus sabdariffa]|uniref:Ribosomal eL28/Mak16 domain-containing protein n=1 Tax=Hibiscus sabdariffa TaxID=183260 RepID=A0ABR2E276_9ROSI
MQFEIVGWALSLNLISDGTFPSAAFVTLLLNPKHQQGKRRWRHKEPNNLYNFNSYKHSGLANKKTVTIQSGGKDQSVLLATTKTKKWNKPSSSLHKSVMKKEFPRMVKAVKNQVTDNYYRPDLTKAALARLSAVHRSLKVAKSGVKKRNRQALKVRGRK